MTPSQKRAASKRAMCRARRGYESRLRRREGGGGGAGPARTENKQRITASRSQIGTTCDVHDILLGAEVFIAPSCRSTLPKRCRHQGAALPIRSCARRSAISAGSSRVVRQAPFHRQGADACAGADAVGDLLNIVFSLAALRAARGMNVVAMRLIVERGRQRRSTRQCSTGRWSETLLPRASAADGCSCTRRRLDATVTMHSSMLPR